MTTQGVPPGWYPEPQDPRTLRWWDGTKWTPNTQPASVPPSASVVQTPAAQVPEQPLAVNVSPASVPVVAAPGVPRHRLFGGKRELEEEVARLSAIVDEMGVNEREALRTEVARLHATLPALQQEEATLLASVGPLRAEVAALSSEREQEDALRSQIAQLTTLRDALKAEIAQLQASLGQMPGLKAEFEELQQHVIETRETAILQEVGVYQYRHPLDDAPAYKARLTGLAAQIKDAVKAGSAVVGSTTWTVNGSKTEGTRMVREFSKLMLRAYNNEADNAVRSMKPYALKSATARLTKAKDIISKLGKTMNIVITDHYHTLRVAELQLTADYLAKVAEEKERNREERARLREEEIARREYEREQDRLRKEQAHYEEAVAALRARGDHDAATEAEAKLGEIQDALEGINRRAANIRAGHVYVISNLGAFGSDIVKIGMTRRLEPMDRVRELGDASVPFHYDVHAMVFSDDAVGLEHHLHHELADCRVNLVNMRREFFRAHPIRVRDLLLALDSSIVTWVEEPEALEWRQSETTRRQLQVTAAS